eukprot:CAMPEP_0206043666 /NCGR_PEP_ID=MMETSP1466-20131121/9740_1 /ASSEMBLY_ACC=CAM_ASM_001126 /TAXON_ID=44452 /ORGANISM="Pavlova gyrans, Strain CCMP608" /LENGTH=56 /DNA_ID=CAMNT_0053418509 /DNA_START=8 /DNA_END=175 /DNA_ORIENTATION=-
MNDAGHVGHCQPPPVLAHGPTLLQVDRRPRQGPRNTCHDLRPAVMTRLGALTLPSR